MAAVRETRTPGNGRFFVPHRRWFPLAVLVAVIGLSAGCSSSDPQIMQVEHRIVAAVAPERGTATERLIVSVDVFDPDGEGELDRLRVAIPAHDIHWDVPAAELDHQVMDGQQWYTARDLVIRGRARIPRGAVDIIATDKAGREARRTVQLPLTLPEPADLAWARLEDGTVVSVPEEADSVLLALVAPEDAVPERREFRVLPSGETDRLDLAGSLAPSMVAPFRRSDGSIPVYLIVRVTPRYWIESGPWAAAGAIQAAE